MLQLDVTCCPVCLLSVSSFPACSCPVQADPSKLVCPQPEEAQPCLQYLIQWDLEAIALFLQMTFHWERGIWGFRLTRMMRLKTSCRKRRSKPLRIGCDRRQLCCKTETFVVAYTGCVVRFVKGRWLSMKQGFLRRVSDAGSGSRVDVT